MRSARHHLRKKAIELLSLATLFWGISFPVMKALGMMHQGLLPSGSSWFSAASALTVRFGLAAVIMLLWAGRTLGLLTGLEIWQGLGLGLFSGAGMLLQMDGLAYTSASTSAFLTQSYCLFLPWVTALRDGQKPSLRIVLCSAMVMGGVAVLAQVNWQTLTIGRGELETLISSVIFAAQILWLERPLFAGNRVSHFTLVMFATMSLVSLPVALITMHEGNDWSTAYSSGPVLLLMAVLVLMCTMIAFVLMNHWQTALPAAEAALIYAAEPVFASLFALFLPAWLSILGGLQYQNEKATLRLLAGGGLITLANAYVQIGSRRSEPAKP